MLVVTSPAALPVAAEQAVPHVWVYHGTQSHRHDSIPRALEVLRELADSTGAFTLEDTQEPADMGPVWSAVLDDTCGNLIGLHSLK